jgi:hypothetical protein
MYRKEKKTCKYIHLREKATKHNTQTQTEPEQEKHRKQQNTTRKGATTLYSNCKHQRDE